MLDQCWATVYDGGPTLIRQWVNGLWVRTQSENTNDQAVSLSMAATSTADGRIG